MRDTEDIQPVGGVPLGAAAKQARAFRDSLK